MLTLTCAACHKPLAASDRVCPACGAAVVILHGKYQIIRELGRGGFGVVQEAIDRTEMRRCAIKIIEQAALNAAQIQGEIATLVGHALQLQFIPNVYEDWVETGRHYIAMQYISGRTLDLIEPKPWPAPKVEHFLRIMLENLVQLHAAQIIHRDIKPVNIKLTDEGMYVLLDFGIAKRGIDAQSIKAMTLSYAPLEQIQHSGTDLRSDLYSLAATAYQLLTNQLPTSALEQLAKALPPPSELVANVPAQLERVIMHMLALDPDDRPDDALAALALLDQSINIPGPEPATEQATQLVQDHSEDELLCLGNGRLYDLAWAPDHQRIVIASATGLYSYHAQTLAEQSARRFDQPLRWVACAPDQPGILVMTDANAQFMRLAEGTPLKTLCAFPTPVIVAAIDQQIQRLAVAAESFIQIWRIAGVTAAPLVQHPIFDRCRALSFAANGALLAAAIGANVIIWNASNGQIHQRLTITRGVVSALAFAAAGEFLATLSSACVQIWRTSDGQLLQTIEAAASRAINVQFLPNASTLIITWDRMIQLRRIADGALLDSFDTLPSPAIDSALSPNGVYLAVMLADDLLLLRITDNKLAGKPSESHMPLQRLRFSHDGKMLAGWSNADITLFHIPDGRMLDLTGKHSAKINSIIYAPDGQSVIVMDGAVRMWQRNETSWQLKHSFAGHTNKLNSLAITSDGATLAAASSAGVTLWSLRDGRLIGQLPCLPAQANALAFTPDGQQLVIISAQCEVWQIDTGVLMRRYAYADDIYDMTISADGRMFAILREELIDIYHTDADDLIAQIALTEFGDSGGNPHIQGIASAADGALLTLIADTRVMIWDVTRGAIQSTINHSAQRAIFAADSQAVALIHDTTFSIWTTDATPQLKHECAGHTEIISDVAFSPDGQQIATASHDGTIRFWNSA